MALSRLLRRNLCGSQCCFRFLSSQRQRQRSVLFAQGAEVVVLLTQLEVLHLEPRFGGA